MTQLQLERVGGRTWASSSLCSQSMVLLTIAQEAQTGILQSSQVWRFERIDEWHVRAMCFSGSRVIFDDVYERDLRTVQTFAPQIIVIKAAQVYIVLPNEVAEFYRSTYWQRDEGVLR